MVTREYGRLRARHRASVRGGRRVRPDAVCRPGGPRDGFQGGFRRRRAVGSGPKVCISRVPSRRLEPPPSSSPLGWCEARGLRLRDISPLHVAAYIRTHPGSAPTVKQHLAAIRMLGDWLVVSQVLPVNPAAAVRGPKHVVTKGATPVLTPAETRKLLVSIDTGALAGLRDRALLSVMLYSFARVSAVLGMRRQDYFGQANRAWLRLHEKGGKRHDVPAHHRAAAALDAYVEAGGLEAPQVALFQTVDPAGRRLTGRALERRLVLAMIKRRAAAAGLPASTCCHTFRATGITAYLSNGGRSSARSRSRGMPRRRRRSSTTARQTR